MRCKYYDHYGAIYYLFLDHLRQNHIIPIQDTKKGRHFEIIQQRQRSNTKKQSHTSMFQPPTHNNSAYDGSFGGYKRVPSESRHSYIQGSNKDINTLQDVSYNSNQHLHNNLCSVLDSFSENRHKSPACYVHVVNQQTTTNSIAGIMNFSNYSKDHMSLSMNPSLSYQSNISNSNSLPQNSLNTNEFTSLYQEPQLPHLSTSPSSLSAHSIKNSSSTVNTYNNSFNTSPSYAQVNSQFSSIINEMENLSETDADFSSNQYESSALSHKYSETDSLYTSDSPRFSHPSESSTGITAQYSNSTDEGVEADMDENYHSQRLSYASSSSSSGVGAQNNSFSQNESCSSFHALTNQSSFESYKDKIKDVTSSLPSCTGTSSYITPIKTKKRKTPSACPSSWRRYSPFIQTQLPVYQFFRNGVKSPSDFREGRRASDGFVTQNEQKGKNVETSSLKESTSKDTIFNPEYCNLTEKAKGYLELHELSKEHYDLKALYDTIMAQDDDLNQKSCSSRKSSYENKFKYPSSRSPTFAVRQSPYYENYRYESALDKDNVFLDTNFSDGNNSLLCKSPTKLHQKWQNVQKQGISYSQVKQNSLPQAEMSPSRSRRKLFRQLKHKLATVPVESYTDDIPTIIEDNSNGCKNDEYFNVHRELTSSTLSHSDNNPHITWNSSVPESDLFQF